LRFFSCCRLNLYFLNLKNINLITCPISISMFIKTCLKL
jgi:hypothetical protein